MKIGVYCSRPQYAAHAMPIWEALPVEHRGPRCAPREALWAPDGRPGSHSLDRWMVASYSDARSLGPAASIYVNHGAGQTYCLAPGTRVLTANLRWVPIETLTLGQEIISFEEERSGPRSWRQWQQATVSGVRMLRRPCYRLTMADGSVVVASAEHRWLRRTNDQMGWSRTEQLRPASIYPSRSSKLIKPFSVWDEDVSWGGGYVAAGFDGEGSFCQTVRGTRQNRMMLSFTQKDNEMLAMMVSLLRAREFRFSVSKDRGDGVRTLSVLGGTAEVLRCLGTFRPRRLMAKIRPLSNGQMRGESVEVMTSEFIGEQDVIGVQTSTGTLIAEGFATHNSGDPRSKAHGAFVGGDGLDQIRLFLDPRQECSDAWLARYPQAVAIPVGVPKMDRWHREIRDRSVPGAHTTPTIALTFHHQGGLCPETTWALPHYRAAIGPSVAAWRAAGCRVVGHGHPLAEASLRRLWAEHDVPWLTVAEVFDQADVLVADNTSLLVEAASAGIPLAWLSAPWYRRDVYHGGRFWDWPLGQVQIDQPEDLTDGVLEALADHPRYRDARARMVRSIYLATDGLAAERAAAAILALVE